MPSNLVASNLGPCDPTTRVCSVVGVLSVCFWGADSEKCWGYGWRCTARTVGSSLPLNMAVRSMVTSFKSRTAALKKEAERPDAGPANKRRRTAAPSASAPAGSVLSKNPSHDDGLAGQKRLKHEFVLMMSAQTLLWVVFWGRRKIIKLD